MSSEQDIDEASQECQKVKILQNLLVDSAQSSAAAQDFVENILIGAGSRSFAPEHSDLTSSFSFLNELIKSCVSRLNSFERQLRNGVIPDPSQILRDRDLFNIGDLNQQVGDVLSAYAAYRSVEVVIRSPFENLRDHPEFYLVFYDRDFLMQLFANASLLFVLIKYSLRFCY